MIRCEIAGLDVAQDALQAIPQRIEAAVLRQMSQIVYDHAERAADRHTKTGALRQSLYNRPIPGGREVGHDPQRAPHAVFVHWGTRPHVIRPKGASLATQRELYGPDGSQRKLTAAGKLKAMPGGRKLVLRWAGPGGAFIFAQFVNHPGYKGDAYMVEAAREAIRRMPEIVARHLKD